ncbi:MAG: hypothetical protein M1836_000885 [Candelina mexicana]|nr:MAG: hypothetical protein M1836_000885 [Candelina mexicana]
MQFLGANNGLLGRPNNDHTLLAGDLNKRALKNAGERNTIISSGSDGRNNVPSKYRTRSAVKGGFLPNHGGLSVLMLLTLLVFASGSLAIPQKDPSASSINPRVDKKWSFKGYKTRTTPDSGPKCSDRQLDAGGKSTQTCNAFSGNEDVVIKGYTYDGDGKFKLCLYGQRDCGGGFKEGVNGGKVTCVGVDSAKAYKIINVGGDC